MADEIAASVPSCPWCSAPLPSVGADACPACGAQLVADTDVQLPGLTAIDAEAIVRAARQPTPQRRSRLLSWISGEYDPGDEAPTPPGSVAPPDLDVRREMLRLELEADIANLQAEAGLVMTDAELEAQERGLSAAPTGEMGEAAEPSADADASGPAEASADTTTTARAADAGPESADAGPESPGGDAGSAGADAESTDRA